MLTDLYIENFAIIDQLALSFDNGLVTFTGETGAGKSIIIDAVEMLLGGRADATMIRSGANHALVEGHFEVPVEARPAVGAILQREALLEDENPSVNDVTLGRELRLNGRNIARLNGRNVSTSLLNEIGDYLVDVHGQSEHLSLLKVRQHVNLLDAYAGAAHEAYQQAYRQLQAVRKELNDLRLSEKDAARRADMLAYQINEIESAHLKDGEEEALKEERNRLANAEGLASLVQQAQQILDEGSPEAAALTDLAGQLARLMSSLARLDPAQTSLDEQSQAIVDALTELGRSLVIYQETIEFNPKRLDQVEERLGLIHNLKRKYGASLPIVITFAEEAHIQLDAITHAGVRIEELEEAEAGLLRQLGNLGQELSQQRHAAAVRLCGQVESELSDLSMSGARFMIQIELQPDEQGAILEDGQRVAFDSTGLDRVEFLVAPNPGEGFKPLVKIASGGETSRLMLALKNVLARADGIPTLIFDEIDQGIGGRVGSVVGHKLWSLARQHQVLCITHLPQLAAYGEQHFRVQKKIEAGRTHTLVEAISGETRLLELAQMMGGISEGTRRSADELLREAGKLKRKK